MKWLKYTTIPIGIFMLVLSLFAPKVNASTSNYEVTFISGSIYEHTNGALYNYSNGMRTNKVIIQNNSVIINTSISLWISFFDINDALISHYYINTTQALNGQAETDGKYTGTLGIDTIPNNAHTFSLTGWNASFGSYTPTTFSQFQTITVSYENPIPDPVLTYDTNRITNVTSSQDLDPNEEVVRVKLDITLNEQFTANEYLNNFVYEAGRTNPTDYDQLVGNKNYNIYLMNGKVTNLPLQNGNTISLLLSYDPANASSGIATLNYYAQVGDPNPAWTTDIIVNVYNDIDTNPTSTYTSYNTNGGTITWLTNNDLNDIVTSRITNQNNGTLVPVALENRYSNSWRGYYGPPTTTREGYTLDGWYLTSNNEVGNLDPANYIALNDYYIIEQPNASLFEALWSIVPVYEVTFLDYDNSFIASGLVTQGESATLPPNPTRTGYRFTGWEPPVSDVQGNITTVAQYVQVFTVTWRDPSFNTLKIETVDSGLTGVAPNYEVASGFVLTGWSPNPQTPVTQDTQYIAQVSPINPNLPPQDYNPITDLLGGVMGASVGAIMTLGTINLFGIYLYQLIFLFIATTLTLWILKAVRG